MSQKIEPCWFCGHADAMVIQGDGFYVQCDNCFARGPVAQNVFSETMAETEARAVTLWNNPHSKQKLPDPQTDAEWDAHVERLGDKLCDAEQDFMDAVARRNAFEGD